MKKIVLAVAAVACATSASAVTTTLRDFTGLDNSGHMFSLDIAVTSLTAPDSAGVPITGISGLFKDGNIFASIGELNTQNDVDNLAFSPGQIADGSGIGFQTGDLESAIKRNILDGSLVFASDAPEFAGFEYSVPLTAVSLSAVPEPATWAFMLVGFGAIGYSMRRSRHMSVNTAGSRATI